MKKTYFNINYEPSKEKVFSAIDAALAEGGRPGYICVADGNILTMVHKNPEYRAVVNGSICSIVDSNWVPLLIKRIYGHEWKQYCGSDIFADITAMRKYRMYFLGTTRNVLDALQKNLLEVDPAIAGMKFEELPFCKVDEFDYEAIAERINADGPDIIWLSLGAPKQEYFASKLAPYLKRGVIIPVGAVFNFRSGLGIQRAPMWMVKCRMEFIYRIFSEPEKQIKRCLNIIRTYPSAYREEKKHKSSQI